MWNIGSMALDIATPSASLAISWANEGKAAFSVSPPKIALPNTFAEWLPLFHTYAAIYTEVYPAEAPALFTYMVCIAELQTQYGGSLWRDYDTSFRRLRALQHSLPWQEIHEKVLNMVKPRAITNNISNNKSNNNNTRSNQPFRGATGGNPPAKSCFAYYYRGTCNKAGCQLTHLCGHCRKPGHPLFKCRKFQNASASDNTPTAPKQGSNK